MADKDKDNDKNKKGFPTCLLIGIIALVILAAMWLFLYVMGKPKVVRHTQSQFY